MKADIKQHKLENMNKKFIDYQMNVLIYLKLLEPLVNNVKNGKVNAMELKDLKLNAKELMNYIYIFKKNVDILNNSVKSMNIIFMN